MKTLFLSTFDVRGGAVKAAYRFKNGLRRIGSDPRILVQSKFDGDPEIMGPSNPLEKVFCKIRPHIDELSVWFYRNCPLLTFQLLGSISERCEIGALQRLPVVQAAKRYGTS